MRVPRRLIPLLACALIAGTPAVAHAQGGAGDDQYQDPFGGSDSGSSSGGGSSNSGSQSGGGGTSTGSQGSGTSAPAPTPAQAPATAPDTSSSGSSSSTAAAPATSSSTAGTATSRSELPRTGFDAPVVALLGIGLLAAGLGLRLRVAHGRRS
jgi:LPXTG-motif cell wall-anchored protein